MLGVLGFSGHRTRFFSHHRNDSPFSFVIKKIFQSDAEDSCDAKESGHLQWSPIRIYVYSAADKKAAPEAPHKGCRWVFATVNLSK
jgi:hypothetical protein